MLGYRIPAKDVKANNQLKNLSEEISGLSKPDSGIKTTRRGLRDTTILAT
jgi:hypothetical protein